MEEHVTKVSFPAIFGLADRDSKDDAQVFLSVPLFRIFRFTDGQIREPSHENVFEIGTSVWIRSFYLI